MRLLLLTALSAVGLLGFGWADDKKEAPKEDAKITKIVIKDMT